MPPQSNGPRRGRAAERPRDDFARRLVRAEFGRFYWDDRLEEELQRSLEESRRKLKAARRRNGPPG